MIRWIKRPCMSSLEVTNCDYTSMIYQTIFLLGRKDYKEEKENCQ